MFQIIPVHEDNIFAFKVMGKLTDADYQKFLPELSRLIEENGPISLLVELEDFHGWEAKAAWDDFEFGRQHDEDFVRIALVTENNLQKWLAKISGAFTSAFFEAKIRTFSRDDFNDAWDWLRAGNQHIDQLAQTEKRTFANIAVAVDFSSHSNLVLNRAVELAQHYNSNLSIISVIEHYTHIRSEYDSIISSYDDAEIDKQLYDNSVLKLKNLTSNIDYPNVRQEVLWGSPKSTILSYAASQNTDLIVLGSHGRHGFARILGSIAHSVAHNAKCDVLIVKLLE